MSAFGGDDASDDDSFGLPEIKLKPLDGSSSESTSANPLPPDNVSAITSGAGESPAPGPSTFQPETFMGESPSAPVSDLAESAPYNANSESSPEVPETSGLNEEHSLSAESVTDDFPEDHDIPESTVHTEVWEEDAESVVPGEMPSIQAGNTTPPVRTEPPLSKDEPEKSPRKNKLLYLLIPAVLVLLAALLFVFYQPSPPEQEEHLKLLEDHIKPKKSKPFSETMPNTTDKGGKSKNGGQPAIAGGTTVSVSVPTGRFYVIVHSSIDRDLVLDSCRKYNKEGMNCKVILSGAHAQFNRLSLADFDNLAAAQTGALKFRPRFGPTVWVLQY